VRDKSWNPGDYVPAFSTSMPTESQRDVVGKGQWLAGKWALEIRRQLISRFPPVGTQTVGDPRPDDVPLVPGRRYMMRISIYDGTTKRPAVAAIPIYLRP